MCRVIIFPYKIASGGASQLAESIREAGVRCVKVRSDGRFTPRRDDLIINWGNGSPPRTWKSPNFMVNLPMYVNTAGNKLLSFIKLGANGVNIPEFTTDGRVANNWNTMFLGRKLLRGHSGAGILVFDPAYPHSEGGLAPAPLSRDSRDWCPLYVKYIKKSAEYRVHVLKGEVVDIQRKRKRSGVEEIDYRVRNHQNGWVFCRQGNDDVDKDVLAQSLLAVEALELDFGAVDVIWNSHYKRAFVLEVNTAPGLTGSTVGIYRDNILKLIQ